jgi:hypothetical protein
MSALKHTICHQQAQLQHLENHLHCAPRIPMSTINNSNSPPPSPLPDPPPSDQRPTTPNGNIKRRSSFDVLQSLAGPDSNIPLPRREPGSLNPDGIREGIPMDFGAGPSTPSYKRQSSPTRTLSRACQSFCVSIIPLSLIFPRSRPSRHTRILRRWVNGAFGCLPWHQ